MVTMENAEEVMQILERFTRLKQKEIPKELDEYLGYVARTGDTVFKWSSLKYLFREKLLNVIKQFHDTTSRIDEIPQYPNVDPFNYESMKSTLLERLDLFNAAPFTIQRLCELLIDPRKQYSRTDKFMRALEKNILVVSTVEPGRKRTESDNGDSLDSVVNGDLLLDVNVDIDMEADTLLNMETQAHNNIPKNSNSTTIAASTTINKNENSTGSSASPPLQDDETGKGKSSKETTIKIMVTHKIDDEMLPHPKKAKLDLLEKTSKDNEDSVKGVNEGNIITEESKTSNNEEESSEKQIKGNMKENSEECLDKVSVDLYQLKEEDMSNKSEEAEKVQQVEGKAEQETPCKMEEIIKDSEKKCDTATSIGTNNVEIASTTKTQSKQSDIIVGSTEGIDEKEDEINEQKVDEEKIELKRENKSGEKHEENLTENKKINDEIEIAQQQSNVIQVREKSKEFETVVEKQELEKCEKGENNVNVDAQGNGDNDKQYTEANDKLLENTLINESNKEINMKNRQEEEETKGCIILKEQEEDLLELQLLSNKTEELVEVIENNKMETIHEDLEEEVQKTIEKERRIAQLSKTEENNTENIIVVIPLKKLDESPLDEKLLGVEEQPDGKLLVEIVEEIQQKRKITENNELEQKQNKSERETELQIEVVPSAKEVIMPTGQDAILNEDISQTVDNASTNQTTICESVAMTTEFCESTPQVVIPSSQIINTDIPSSAVAAAPSIIGDSIIVLPTTITPIATLSNTPLQDDQPMIEDVTIEEEASPTVEEVIMAEPSIQLGAPPTIAAIPSSNIMDEDPSSMEVDDTSQEAMDQ